MNATTPPSRPYALPSTGSIVLGSAVRVVLFGLFFLGWPWIAARALGSFGLPFPFPLGTTLLFGVLLTALAVASYATKSTRAFGPASVAYDAALLGYLYWLATVSRVSLSFMGIGLSLSFPDLFYAFMIAPAIGLVADLVTTAEDALHPTERYPFDFPA